MDLFRHALAEKIGIAPGLIFSAKADYRNYIRLTMGAGWNERIDRALEQLGKLVDSRMRGACELIRTQDFGRKSGQGLRCPRNRSQKPFATIEMPPVAVATP